MKSHIERMKEALLSELAFSEQEHRACMALPFAERVSIGASWPPARLDAFELGYDGLRLHCRQSNGVDFHDGILPGTPLCLAPIATPLKGLHGICTDVQGAHAQVLVRGWRGGELPGWLQRGDFGISSDFDGGSLRNYLKGLERALSDPFPLAGPLCAWSGEGAPEDLPIHSGLPEDLNSAQRTAASAALRDVPVGIVHGPPGTGKTHTLVAVLQGLVSKGERPWALADSNAAVDNVCRASTAAGLDVLRIGNRFRIAPDVWSSSVWGRAERHPQRPALDALKRDFLRAKGSDRRRLSMELRRIRRSIHAQIMEGCDLLAATFGSMSRESSRLGPVRTILVDEATQAIEPAIWSVAHKASRIVLFGDQHQLGPVVEEPGNPLGKSLLQRLVESSDTPPPMLGVQHRMNRRIMSLVSETYGPAFRPHPSVEEHTLSELHGVSSGFLTETPLLWIDTAGFGADEERDPVTFSLRNPTEAALAAELTDRLLSLGVSPGQIGIIAPYSAQVALLRSLRPSLRSDTVNAFQGSEREAVICSFVRSSPSGDLGFVSDPRRLTVAATRGRRLWIGIGDSATLGRCPHFSRLFDAVEAHGCWQSIWEWEQ
jgi:ATP-dependent RNA/DNA helicase IGHMBP2